MSSSGLTYVFERTFEGEVKECSFLKVTMSRAMTRKYVLRPFLVGLWILFALLRSKSKFPNQTRSVLTNLEL